MNCDEFDQRMQRLIDDRDALADDEPLNAHASRCHDCGQRMYWWGQIDSVVSTPVQSADAGLVGASFVDAGFAAASSSEADVSAAGGKKLFAWSLFAAVAAGLLVAFLVGTSGHDANRTPVAKQLPASADQPMDVDPARWWRDVQGRDWISQTMPAVQSVRDGVAPLGRSIKHAVAILTSGGGEQTS